MNIIIKNYSGILFQDSFPNINKNFIEDFIQHLFEIKFKYFDIKKIKKICSNKYIITCTSKYQSKIKNKYLVEIL
jgi:hypothetical protein